MEELEDHTEFNPRGRQRAIAESTDNPSGMQALGVKVPSRRLTAALDRLRELAPDLSTENALALIGKAAFYIEEDQPYKAQRVLFQDAPNWNNSSMAPPSVEFPCESPLDLCGSLMIYSYLLTG